MARDLKSTTQLQYILFIYQNGRFVEGPSVRWCSSGARRLRDGHFGLVTVLVSNESQSDGLAIGSLPRDGSLGSGAGFFADLLLSTALGALDAISGLEPFNIVPLYFKRFAFNFQNWDLRKGVAAVLLHVELVAHDGHWGLGALRSRWDHGNHGNQKSNSQRLRQTTST